MTEIPEQYVEDTHFLEWLNRCFNATAEHATAEDLAEFAFGDVKTAIAAYDEEEGKNHP
jgi:hypothetical protein